MGALIGAGAVAAAIGDNLESPDVASVLLVTGGGISGAIAGALIATPLVRYIPDNRALYIMGDMWIGAVEGFSAGMIWEQVHTYQGPVVSPCTGPHPCRPSLGVQLRGGFVGSLPGLVVGLTTGVLTADRAPTYGRATLIQSAALGGFLTGALVQLTLRWQPYGEGWQRTIRQPNSQKDIDDNDGRIGTGPMQSEPCMFDPMPGATQEFCSFKSTSVLDLMPGALIGLNVGLAAGLLGAYLPDQTKYGPSWKRVLLIDLAVGAGMVAGGVAGCVANTEDCLTHNPSATARAISAGAALAGGAFGFVGGWFLTRHVDDDAAPSPVASSLHLLPMAMPGSSLPALMALATF
jgi:hypothetical protein